MSLTNPNTPISQQDLQDFYHKILPYMRGGIPEVLANKFSKGDMYSTEEKMIGQWTDGKPIYQKVVPCSITSGSRHWQTLATISDVDTFVFVYAIVSNYVLGGYWGSSANDYTGLMCNASTGMVSTVVNGMVTGDGFVIVQYTKTNDTAISIGSDTDYSTEEKIVGTWVDGKPIYQKTFTGLSKAIKYNVWETLVSIPDIYMVIDVALYGDAGADTHQVKFDTAGIEFLANNGYISAEYTVNAPGKRTVNIITVQYTKTTD